MKKELPQDTKIQDVPSKTNDTAKKALVKETSKPAPSKELQKKYYELLASKKELEEKIRFTISFLYDYTQIPNPNLKEFFEVKNVCIDLFKEKIEPRLRKTLWDEFIEISHQMNMLKKALNEKAEYSLSQIEQALILLQKDIAEMDTNTANVPAIIFPRSFRVSNEKAREYVNLQKKATLLGSYTSKLSSLRKELIETSLRMKDKKNVLKMISSMGDLVYPSKKECVEKLSNMFLEDVNTFFAKWFQNTDELPSIPVIKLKDEIKSFQSLSKSFSLNTKAFKQTREILSKAWDTTRKWDEKRKQVLKESEPEFQENFIKAESQLSAHEKMMDSLENGDKQQIITKSDEMLSFLKNTKLRPDQFRDLREKTFKLRDIHLDKADEKSKKAKEEKVNRVNLIKEEAKELLTAVEEKKIASPLEKLSDLRSKDHSFLSKADELYLENQYLTIEVKALLNDEYDQTEKLEEIERLLKNRIKQYKKAVTTTGLGFEMALLYRELIDSSSEILQLIQDNT